MLEQTYLTAKDLTKIIPNLHINKARQYIKEAQEEMKQKNYFIPETKEKVALTKIIRKRFGI